MTENSRSSVADTSTRDTPGMRLRSGRIWNIAMSRRSAAGRSPVMLKLIIGKSDGVMRSTRISVPAGRSGRTSSTLPCINCSAYGMSASGLKMTEISVAPRIVRDRTRRTPSTSRAASSSGRVTATSMIRGARSPECATMAMRGNSTSG